MKEVIYVYKDSKEIVRVKTKSSRKNKIYKISDDKRVYKDKEILERVLVDNGEG
jgi:hypothetical protein